MKFIIFLFYYSYISTLYAYSDLNKFYCVVYFKDRPSDRKILHGVAIDSMTDKISDIYLVRGNIPDSKEFQHLDIYQVRHTACTISLEEAQAAIKKKIAGKESKISNEKSDDIQEYKNSKKDIEVTPSKINSFEPFNQQNKSEGSAIDFINSTKKSEK